MGEDKRLSPRVSAAAVLLCGLAVTLLLVGLYVWSARAQDRRLALHSAEVYSARTEQLLDSLFHKTDVLGAILIADKGALSEQTFQDLARSLDDGAGIQAIQCLPDGVVRYCYPLEGNEAVIGTSVFDDPKRRKDAMLAVETRSIALSGPYELYQGGLGLVARNPVFLPDENGGDVFWGFTVIILNLPDALEPLMLDELTEEGYAYRLHCVIDTGEEMTVAEAGTLRMDDAIDYTIHVPNHEWTLSLAPEKGWTHWGVVAILVLAGALISLLVATIIYQWRERARALRRASLTDELTGLYNRRYLNDAVDRFCDAPAFGLLYMDLLRFKQINDTLGHHWGDALLVEASRRILETLGHSSLLARVGGDEFVAVTLCGTCGGDCRDMIARIEQAFQQPFLLDGKPVTIGISIGCARYPEDGADYDALMREADRRMYIKKRAQRRDKEE